MLPYYLTRKLLCSLCFSSPLLQKIQILSILSQFVLLRYGDLASPLRRLTAYFSSPLRRLTAYFSSPLRRLTACFSGPLRRLTAYFSAPFGLTFSAKSANLGVKGGQLEILNLCMVFRKVISFIYEIFYQGDRVSLPNSRSVIPSLQWHFGEGSY